MSDLPTPAPARPAGMSKTNHVASVIRDRIRSGEYAAGSQLPTETELGRMFSPYDRTTVRRGIAVLRQEGLIFTDQGRGTYVRSKRRLRHPILERMRAEDRHEDGQPMGLFEAGTGVSEDDVSVQIEYAKVDAPEDLAEEFNVAPGEPLLARRYVFVVDGEPHQITVSYLLYSMIEGTHLADKANEKAGRGTATQLREIGIAIESTTVDISARPPTPEESATLSIDPATPVLFDRRCVRASGGRTVAVADTVTPSDRISFWLQVDHEAAK